MRDTSEGTAHQGTGIQTRKAAGTPAAFRIFFIVSAPSGPFRGTAAAPGQGERTGRGSRTTMDGPHRAKRAASYAQELLLFSVKFRFEIPEIIGVYR